MVRNKPWYERVLDQIRNFKYRSFQSKVFLERQRKQLFPLHSPGKDQRSSWRVNFYKKIHTPLFARLETEFYKHSLFHFAAGFLGILLFVLCGYILFFSPYFHLAPSKIIIERSDTLSDISITSRAVEPFIDESILFLDTTEVETAIFQLQKNISKVRVKKVYPQGLNIIITSYPPVLQARIDSKDSEYIITQNGVLIYSRESTGKLMEVDIIDAALQEGAFRNYKTIFSQEKIQSITLFITEIKKILTNTKIVRTRLFLQEREIHFTLENGTVLLFSTQMSLTKQLTGFYLFFREKGSLLQNTSLSYLDARVPGKVFTCTSGDVCKNFLVTIYGNTYK